MPMRSFRERLCALCVRSLCALCEINLCVLCVKTSYPENLCVLCVKNLCALCVKNLCTLLRENLLARKPLQSLREKRIQNPPNPCHPCPINLKIQHSKFKTIKICVQTNSKFLIQNSK